MKNDSKTKLTQAERSKERKERIVQEANRLFGQSGFRGTKLADIAEAAGLTEPGLLHHYPSKEHLLISILEERDRVNRQRFGEMLKKADGKNSTEVLQALVEYSQNTPEVVRLFTMLVSESIDPAHPGHEFFVRRYRFCRQEHLEILKSAQQRGQIRADIRVEDLSVLVMALMDGLQIQWLLDPEQVDMASAFKLFIQILTRGIQEQPVLQGDAQ
jgi:AcrR family transcriptional regulator